MCTQPEVIWADGAGDAPCTHDSVHYWKAPQFLSWLYNESPVNTTVVANSRCVGTVWYIVPHIYCECRWYRYNVHHIRVFLSLLVCLFICRLDCTLFMHDYICTTLAILDRSGIRDFFH